MTDNIVQAAIGFAFVGYAVYLTVQRLRTSSFWGTRTAAPLDDIRIVSDLSARLRNEGKTEAVSICLQLLAELLKPEAKA